jgi:hypothetical protein
MHDGRVKEIAQGPSVTVLTRLTTGIRVVTVADAQ